MSGKDTGGPAFAQQLECNRDGYAVTGGMTLRDYFAAKAMQGLIARESTGAFNFETYLNDPWRVALWAYDVADQMLKARAVKEQTK
jgi:hypothetical protein